MKKTIIFTFLLTTLISCNQQDSSPVSKYKMKCESVGGNMTRCENKEAICYAEAIRSEYPEVLESAPSCKFKEPK